MQIEFPITSIQALQNNECLEFAIYEKSRPYFAFLVKKDDHIYAYANSCPHQGRMLQWKPNTFLTKDSSLIMCGAHGATFEIDTGLCVGGPCTGASLNRLPVFIRNGVIIVSRPQ